MNQVKVCFSDSQYDYVTTVNGTTDEIEDYFLGQIFNFGNPHDGDNLQQCVMVKFDWDGK